MGLVKRHGEYKRKNPIGVLPLSKNNSNSALIIAGGGHGITAFCNCMLEWYADQDIQSVFSKYCFLRLAIAASGHLHSSLIAGELKCYTGLLIMGTLSSSSLYTSVLLREILHMHQ